MNYFDVKYKVGHNYYFQIQKHCMFTVKDYELSAIDKVILNTIMFFKPKDY